MKSRKKHFLNQIIWPLVAIVLSTASVASVQATGQKSLAGHVPAVTSSLQPLGELNATNSLPLSISLPLRNQAALSNLLTQIYDPASPLYHHYLTPAEFDARFGPTEQDYAAVIAFATSHGFKIVGQHPNRMLLQVKAAVPDIENAFQIKLHTYQHPTEKRLFYAPDSEPTVAAEVPILGIAGLENYSRPHPSQLHHKAIPANNHHQNLVGSGPNGLLAATDFRAAYVPGVSLRGSGQSIGLVEFDAYYASDIVSYASQTGLTNVPLSAVRLDGYDGTPYSGNSEVALDIEMAMAMAPALAGIVVYEADPNNGLMVDVLQAMSTNTTIRQFSCSWSENSTTAAEQSALDAYFTKMVAQGQSFFCASGDSGAYTTAMGAPVDDLYVTSVGGTTLSTAGPGGAWVGETVWNMGYGTYGGSSGGGASTVNLIPGWQKGVSMAANGGSTTYRNVPDVAMAADNIFIVADSGLNEVAAGTSAAAPLWAGYNALLNEQATNNKLAPVGFLNPALYHLGTNSAFTACFNDVTSGNNTNSSAKEYVAVAGYDLCTGWGSANGGSLLIALTKPDGFQITPGRGQLGNGPAGGPFTTSTQTFVLTNNGSTALSWALGTTSSWLNVSATSGTLAPAGAATLVSAKINASTSLLPAGVYTADLWFTNLTSGLAQLRQFTLQIGQNLVQDGSFEAFDFCYWTITGANDGVFANDYVDDGNTYSTGYTPEDGDYYAAMGQSGSLAYYSQTIPTYPGQVYRLSFWLANPFGYTPNQFQVQWNTNGSAANTIFTHANFGTLGWSNMVFNVVAATTNTTLRFGFRNDNDFLDFDNVTLTPLPGPIIESVIPISGGIQLTWSAIAGLSYQLQYKTDLTQSSWVNLGSAVKATSAQMTTSDLSATDAVRYYRIVAP